MTYPSSEPTTGACPEILTVGDMGYYRLTCRLEPGHPDLHWDEKLSVAWWPWTSEQEAARARHDWKRAQ